MSADNGAVSATALTETLQFALAQCREQVQTLARQCETIDQLRRQNEQLKQELDNHRTSSRSDLEKKYQKQFQNLFQQNATKQAEIDKLKEKLRNVREKARRRGLVDPISSSPALPVGGDVLQPADQPPEIHQPSGKLRTAIDKQPLDRSQTPDAGSRRPIEVSKKRTRSLSPPVRLPLQEVSINVNAAASKKEQHDARVKKRRPSDRGAAAIPLLTEDGESHSHPTRKPNLEQKPKPLRESVYQRLDNLLENHDSTCPSLHNPPDHQSNATKNTKIATPGKSIAPPFGLLTPATTHTTKTRKAKITTAPGPEDEEPLRSRPLNRQTLSHFKPNPLSNSGVDYAYHNPRQPQFNPTTIPALNYPPDHDLLQALLGPDSESRIQALTPKARENLLHEARVKHAANSGMYGNGSEQGRPQSPPGFWSTDWPGTQEERDNREKAKKAEREEVERRYADALRGGGRWMFADE